MVQVQSKGKPITAKSVGNFLSNNAIIILILLLAIFVGLFTENFFTLRNFKNLLIHHRLWCFGLSDYKRYRPVCRTYGRSVRLSVRYAVAGC